MRKEPLVVKIICAPRSREVDPQGLTQRWEEGEVALSSQTKAHTMSKGGQCILGLPTKYTDFGHTKKN